MRHSRNDNSIARWRIVLPRILVEIRGKRSALLARAMLIETTRFSWSIHLLDILSPPFVEGNGAAD